MEARIEVRTFDKGGRTRTYVRDISMTLSGDMNQFWMASKIWLENTHPGSSLRGIKIWLGH